MTDSPDLERLICRIENILGRVEMLLPTPPANDEPSAAIAYRWRKVNQVGYLFPVRRPHRVRLDDLRRVERQKEEIDRNTRQFVGGLPANNVLLSGSRGTGKSTLIKALLNEYAPAGLRLIEVEKLDLIDLPEIVERLGDRKERFILFCDDLSFEGDDSSYKSLKAVLDGSVSAPPDNVLVYATSNRRHLMPEYMRENLAAKYDEDGEVHPGETVEEKISLSERFGLWLSFYPFSQDEYLRVVEHWLGQFKLPAGEFEEARREALQWALMRGSRSGRVAWQFARDYAGRHED